MTHFTLATLSTPAGLTAAIGVGDKYYPLSQTQQFKDSTVRCLLEDWTQSLASLEKLAEAAQAGKLSQSIAARDATLETPVRYPNKVACAGANFTSHLKEMGFTDLGKWDILPVFLAPPTTTLVGPGTTVKVPRTTQEFDWELEMVVVVGKRLRHASREEAAAAIAGYMVGLDLSCRDLAICDNQLKIDFMRGKLQDTMTPAGPVLVPAKFVPDPDNLRMTLFVNDRKMQDASTNEMLFKCDEILAVTSSHVTLEPGDLVYTGTPSGQAKSHGVPFLQVGDKICGRIEGIGELNVTLKSDD
ncbi:Fumarylacetoacetate hydrolase domain-containing protein 2B [Cladophialophora carrionii]|uniref:Fumarylacetoacetate hydrolase domain-containing protein 2B n=1 Tax=Cladophialophora carrionii TaxID=86049 RepID=A0A1C1C8F2_9EURO|nr:Fumarylacetoacetate hydrolase domain-containing protein 2B [Cladophialophora carrionii]